MQVATDEIFRPVGNNTTKLLLTTFNCIGDFLFIKQQRKETVNEDLIKHLG